MGHLHTGSTFDSLSKAERIRHLGEVAARALPHWDVSPDARLTLLNISENATYRVDDPGAAEPVILRVHRTARLDEGAQGGGRGRDAAGDPIP